MGNESKKDDDSFLSALRETFVEEAAFLLEDMETELMRLEEGKDREKAFRNIFRLIHSLKGSGSTVGYHALTGFAHHVEDFLSLLQERLELVDVRMVTLLLQCADMLRRMAGCPPTGLSSEVTLEAEELVAKLEAVADGLESSQGMATPRLDDAGNDGEMFQDSAVFANGNGNGGDGDGDGPQSKKNFTSLKVEAQRVDDVMSVVGEMVVLKSLIMQNKRLSDATDSESTAMLTQLDRTVRDLHDRALALRLSTLDSLFRKVQRTARDLSVRLSKRINFEIVGESTELDRAIIDHLDGPLIHLCRNALDHGMEDEETRKKNGKNPVGRISISARYVGSSVEIELSDDGAGIRSESVLAKAVDQGVVSADATIDNFSEQEVFDLIFSPGFSTAEEVSDISGRGVGLDVVKGVVQDLKGSIAVSSSPGVGTKFTLSLPFTTAITDGIIVAVGAQKYILPIETISEFIDLQQTRVTTIDEGADAIEIRDEMIPLVRLSHFLGAPESERGIVVVSRTRGRRIGMLVEKVFGHSQIVLKRLPEAVDHADGISGAAILGDGRVGLVLDPGTIWDLTSVKRSHHSVS